MKYSIEKANLDCVSVAVEGQGVVVSVIADGQVAFSSTIDEANCDDPQRVAHDVRKGFAIINMMKPKSCFFVLRDGILCAILAPAFHQYIPLADVIGGAASASIVRIKQAAKATD